MSPRNHKNVTLCQDKKFIFLNGWYQENNFRFSSLFWIKTTPFHKVQGKLIHATQPFERLNIDFKGPLPSFSQNKYVLTIIDEYSQFPFAFPCPDMSSSTVIKCLSQLFSIFGMPGYIHSDWRLSLISTQLKFYLNARESGNHSNQCL